MARKTAFEHSLHTRTWCWHNVISARRSECQLKATFLQLLVAYAGAQVPLGRACMGAGSETKKRMVFVVNRANMINEKAGQTGSHLD